jgi:DNA-binding beta-propeller fold protein YncE
MALFLRKARACFGAAAIGTVMSACYSAGGGSDPPLKSFYFPVGLAVSPDGAWLAVVNSDFDLQYSGGTLQTYDLRRIRNDTLNAIAAAADAGNCASQPPPDDLLGLACARPVGAAAGVYWADPSSYWTDGVVVGAFATDLLQLSLPGWQAAPPLTTRLFAPIRGTTAVLYADLRLADGTLECQGRNASTCGSASNVGSDPNSLHDTRQVVLSGEPFGIAQTDDGTAFVVTSESDTTTSVFTSGIPLPSPLPDGGAAPSPEIDIDDPLEVPALQYVLGGLPAAGTGIAEIPHDPLAWPTCGPSTAQSCWRPAFLETNHSTAQIDLLRYYSDDGTSLPVAGVQITGAQRPFLQLEGVYPLTATTGSDERGIVIDDSPRAICHAGAQATALGCNDASVADPATCIANAQAQDVSCRYLPASVFVATRTPPALLLGQVGDQYNPDDLSIQGTLPLPPGPSKVYRAPVIDSQGNYSLRIFVTCFDSNLVIVYDPTTQLWDSIHVGSGPFAMAFDPFPTDRWGMPPDPNQPPYRFAYVASFTQSFIEVIDLDNSQTTVPSTYESIVYALGQPTLPKGQ